MKNTKIRALTEGAIMIALAQILGYLKFYQMPYGGSVTLAMIPIIFFAFRWGAAQGLAAGFVYGMLQLLLDGAYAYTWQAMILDYFLAYTVLGVAGCFRGKRFGIFTGTVVAVFLRFITHTLAGVFVWAEYMPDSFIGMKMTSPWVYSPIYNGIYMGLNLVICVVGFAVLYRPLNKYIKGRDIEALR